MQEGASTSKGLLEVAGDEASDMCAADRTPLSPADETEAQPRQRAAWLQGRSFASTSASMQITQMRCRGAWR
eukprot:CAMPEP_0204038828 /NCGR_PEP_ID=MMETSP0360-20130528/88961_1 /ASSEMBLY_ACC=CAM_ASM_000342 /TAXON_ID=268821 /ORGANISM="Scrippsiella Hangoei, Strain SHTV-5" /LENGTH=71 /DNA_ID=CAMNT_0050984605 /DNA_START=148 /DNA_END=360 /DNA_ORIENTATION=+